MVATLTLLGTTGMGRRSIVPMVPYLLGSAVVDLAFLAVLL